jgi:hypothetical protein
MAVYASEKTSIELIDNLLHKCRRLPIRNSWERGRLGRKKAGATPALP